MQVPADRKYSETHEWFIAEGDIITIGITQYAADELTDVTYIELPEVGSVLACGDAVGEVESVKATSEIFTVVAGEVVEVNTSLVDHPELVNDDAFEEGWMVRLRTDSVEPLSSLMDATGYVAFVQNSP